MTQLPVADGPDVRRCTRTQDSPMPSSARVTCEPMNPSPPVIKIIAATPSED